MTEDQVEKILAKDTLSESDKKLLDDFEPNSGKNALYSFFTPKWLCQVVYDLAKRYGFNENNGKILEPSAGTGNFLSVIKKNQNVTAFEIDSLNSRIIRKLYPEVKLYEQYFETAFLKAPRYTQRINKNGTWLEDHPFDLVITNPPFGTDVKNLYSANFKKPKFKKLEAFFMYLSGLQLKKGGLLAYVTASAFIRNTYEKDKRALADMFHFIDAYRLPDNIFKNTKAPSDIIIFRKK